MPTTPESELDDPFLNLSDYCTPSMPTQDSVRRWYDSLIRYFKSDDQVEAENKSSLEQASRPLLDQAVQRPAYAFAIQELDEVQLPWISNRRSGQSTDDQVKADSESIRLVVMPPCETANVLRVWAENHGLEILQPPPREKIATSHSGIDSDIDSAVQGLLKHDGPVVIPRLEDFFVRHHNGLELVRTLLMTVNQTDRRILIGCNAWAWAFLKATVAADKMLPTPITFAPYRADRLEQWLYTMIEGEGGSDLKLKFYGAYNKDQNSDSPSQLFFQLAALSRGTPWIAWAMIRSRLELAPQNADAAVNDSNDQPSNNSASPTEIWVAPVVERAISPKLRSSGLLVLHSLLIHGELTMNQLKQTVPAVSDFNVVYGLLRSGFLERDHDRLRCSASMYRTVRKELSTAGFPIAEL